MSLNHVFGPSSGRLKTWLHSAGDGCAIEELVLDGFFPQSVVMWCGLCQQWDVGVSRFPLSWGYPIAGWWLSYFRKHLQKPTTNHPQYHQKWLPLGLPHYGHVLKKFRGKFDPRKAFSHLVLEAKYPNFCVQLGPDWGLRVQNVCLFFWTLLWSHVFWELDETLRRSPNDGGNIMELPSWEWGGPQWISTQKNVKSCLASWLWCVLSPQWKYIKKSLSNPMIPHTP